MGAMLVRELGLVGLDASLTSEWPIQTTRTKLTRNAAQGRVHICASLRAHTAQNVVTILPATAR